jgi:hypothetical protein
MGRSKRKEILIHFLIRVADFILLLQDIKHHRGAPARKPWMLEHADDRREHHRHQPTPKTNKFDQQPTTQTSPKSNLDRQQERAKVRNEARNSQSKNSTRNVGDIWEVKIKKL